MSDTTVQIPPKRIDQALAYTFKNDVAGVRALLVKNGFDPSKLSTPDMHIAFLKAIKDSPMFRNQASDYLASVVKTARFKKSTVATASLNFVNQPQLGFVNQPTGTLGFVKNKKSKNFVNQPGGLGFVNQPGSLSFSGKKNKKTNLNAVDTVDSTDIDSILNSSDTTDDSSSIASATVDNSSPASPSATINAPSSSSGSITASNTGSSGSSPSFWDTLTSSANLTKLFNTGLDTLSTKLKSDANSTTEKNALTAEQLKLQQIQAKNAGTGMPTWGIVALVVLGAAAVAGVVYFEVKKKKA